MNSLIIKICIQLKVIFKMIIVIIINLSIKNFPFIRDVRIGPSSMSPSRSSSIFGLTTNFLDVAYGDYLVTTSKNNLKSDLSGDGEANVVSDMIKGQGKITLVGEESEAGSTSSNQNKLRVVTTRKGVLPTCTTAAEFEYLFLQCQKGISFQQRNHRGPEDPGIFADSKKGMISVGMPVRKDLRPIVLLQL